MGCNTVSESVLELGASPVSLELYDMDIQRHHWNNATLAYAAAYYYRVKLRNNEDFVYSTELDKIVPHVLKLFDKGM